jgi:cytochrome P450
MLSDIPPMDLPPGPRAPGHVNTVNWLVRPVDFMESCRRRFGEWFTVRFGRLEPMVFISDPAAMKTLFTADPSLFPAARASSDNAFVRLVGPNSVFNLDGERHRRERRLLLPPFHARRVSSYGARMAAIANRELDRWPTGEPFPLEPRFRGLTMEIVLETVFGVAGRPADELRRALVAVSDLSMGTWRFLPLVQRIGLRRLERIRAEVDEILRRLIQSRREQDVENRDDVLSLLITARDEDGRAMGDAELCDELVSVLLAGYETTTTQLAWAFERLLRHPRALDRLVAEISEGEDSYLEAVIQETMRVRPVIPVLVRMTSRDTELNGHSLPAETMLVPCVYLTNTHPEVYPDPHAFRPERFLNQAPNPFSWIPFGGGIRRCIGAAFATYEMRIILRSILARTTLEAESAAPEPIRRRSIILRPGRGAMTVLKERRPLAA